MYIHGSIFRLRDTSVNGDVQISTPARRHVNVVDYSNNPLLPS